MFNPATEEPRDTKISHSKEVKIDEKYGRKSFDTPEIVEGEVVAIDKDGNANVIRETDYSEAEYIKLLRKIDRYLLPLMWFCYGIQQTDKTAISTQAIFGLIEDTNLDGQQYSWLTTIFYITYLIGEFPSNFLLQRWSIGKTLSIYMLCWGENDMLHVHIG
jgi:MFS transporter, ACS family, allantoate permease